ncbi:MAG: hypothetical protein NXH75_03685 [Halobacteriovoraceae bacterium]|nr:hypothetical protein [Halobacteriovoraceae bacterium]
MKLNKLNLLILLGTTLAYSCGETHARTLEEVISKRDQTSSHIDGPNCWNGALYGTGVVPTLRFMHPDEWLLHIEEHCSEISDPKKGDLGRIYHPQDGEVHGFIHLDKDTIFAKHGENSQHGYQVMSYEEMLDQYGRTRKCRMSNSFEPECIHQVKYYRCSKSKKDFVYQEVSTYLQKIAFDEQTKWSFKSKCSDTNFLKREAYLNNIINLEEAFKEEVLEGKITPQFWSALFESYSTQIYNIQVSNRSFRCKPRKIKYQTVKKVREMMDRLNSLVK